MAGREAKHPEVSSRGKATRLETAVIVRPTTLAMATAGNLVLASDTTQNCFSTMSDFDDFRLERLSSLRISNNSPSNVGATSSSFSTATSAFTSGSSLGFSSLSSREFGTCPSTPDPTTPSCPAVPRFRPPESVSQGGTWDADEGFSPTAARSAVAVFDAEERSTPHSGPVNAFFSWKRVGSRSATPISSPATNRVWKRRR